MNQTTKTERSFVSNEFDISWEEIEPYFKTLVERSIDNKEALIEWLEDRSELAAVLEEEFAWRYIKMNIETENTEYQKAFQFFVQEINPKLAPYQDQLNRKLYESPYKKDLKAAEFQNLLKSCETQIALYREENIPLFTQLEEDAQKFGALAAKMSVEIEGKEYTLQQAAKFLKSTDRTKRENAYRLIQQRRLSDKKALNELFDELLELRQKVAKNADFNNYRDYKFKALERFDYSVQDCEIFHQSIKQKVVPLANAIDQKRKELLQLDSLRPWDRSVDLDGKEPLEPFETADELIEKTIQCFDRIDPFFGDCIREMKRKKHLDLESKKGKAPGGFNYPLYESGLPFIFMNAVGSMRDVTTMLHEGGHAIHSVLSHPLDLVEFKSPPSEVAELASMSMELISMDQWDVFFDNEEDLNRAKREQLMDVLSTLPWVATIDKFQHWLYTNPNHSHEERYAYWSSLMDNFGSSVVDWSGLEEERKNLWQKQLHLFEVPFYYIEYGMAQLGAIALWRNYRKNPTKTTQQYKEALELGYTRSIGEIYQTAGIEFNFSEAYVGELMNFIQEEINLTFKTKL